MAVLAFVFYSTHVQKLVEDTPSGTYSVTLPSTYVPRTRASRPSDHSPVCRVSLRQYVPLPPILSNQFSSPPALWTTSLLLLVIKSVSSRFLRSDSRILLSVFESFRIWGMKDVGKSTYFKEWTESTYSREWTGPGIRGNERSTRIRGNGRVRNPM